MKKVLLFAIAFVMIFSLTACTDMVKEKITESWWDGKAEVIVVFPKNVKQGESFEIKVITRNLLSEDLIKSVPSCCASKGIVITAIKHRSSNYEIAHWHFTGHDDGIATLTIPFNGQIETIWTFEEELETAPKGTYDVYLDNGEVFRNAIKIN